MSDTIKIKQIPEIIIPGKRLGRHIEHDPRSHDFSYERQAVPIVDTLHKSYGLPLNQGEIGSCPGNGAAGCINSDPVYSAIVQNQLGGDENFAPLTEDGALKIYELATQLDNIPGVYPPDDTGSTGLAAAKAAVKLGYVKAYRHCFNVDVAISALMQRPVMTGVNWYEGFDTPDANGLVEIAGQVRGGHEFVVVGYHPNLTNPLDSLVEAVNSWGTTFGKLGHFFFTIHTWGTLLSQEGDVTVLVVN